MRTAQRPVSAGDRGAHHGLSLSELVEAVHAAQRAHGRSVRSREVFEALTPGQRARLGLGVRGLAVVLRGLGVCARSTHGGHAAWSVE